MAQAWQTALMLKLPAILLGLAISLLASMSLLKGAILAGMGLRLPGLLLLGLGMSFFKLDFGGVQRRGKVDEGTAPGTREGPRNHPATSRTRAKASSARV